MFRLLAKIVTRGWPVILIAWPLTAIVLGFLAPDLDSVTTEGISSKLPPNVDSEKASALLKEAFGAVPESYLIIMITAKSPLTPADDNVIHAVFNRLTDKVNHWVIRVSMDRWNSPEFGSRFVSGDKTTEMCAVDITTEFVSSDTVAYVDAVLAELRRMSVEHPNLAGAITGSAAVGRDYGKAAITSLERTRIATYSLVVLILVIIYRSPVAPIIPLLTIGLSLKIATQVAALLALGGIQVTKLVPIFLIVILFGSGTDFCLFLIGRFREEMSRGQSKRDAAGVAIARVGAAITASGGTTIVGLSMMAFAEFDIFRTTGPIIGLGLAIALLASLTFAPSLMLLLGKGVFWPGKVLPIDPAAGWARFWHRLAANVVRRPGLVFILACLVLLPFAYVGLKVQPSYDLFSELPESSPSVAGHQLIDAKFDYTSRPEQLTMVVKADANFRSPDGLRAAETVWRRLAAEPDVVEVRSVVTPLGEPVEALQRFMVPPTGLGAVLGGVRSLPELFRDAPLLQRVFDTYTSKDGKIAKFDVVLRGEAFSPACLERAETLRPIAEEALRRAAVKGFEVHFTGISAHMHDLGKVTTADLHRLIVLVLVAIFIILAWLLRTGGAPIYLIATIVLTYVTALGIAQNVFVDLVGREGLDWKVQFFLFVLLVAIGVDYNIFLMTRLREERKDKPLDEAVRRSVVFTGGIISSCGVIMAGTFGSLMFSTLAVMKQIGFAMAVGVLLDTFVVRPIMVPAIVLMLDRAWKKIRHGESPGSR